MGQKKAAWAYSLLRELAVWSRPGNKGATSGVGVQDLHPRCNLGLAQDNSVGPLVTTQPVPCRGIAV